MLHNPLKQIQLPVESKIVVELDGGYHVFISVLYSFGANLTVFLKFT